MKELIESRLKFDAKTHTYKLGKKKLTSVTEFIGSFFQPFDREKISKYSAKKHGKTQQEMLDEWDAIAQAGTDIHNEIEEYVYVRDDNGLSTKALFGSMFLNDTDYMNNDRYMSMPELKVFSEELGLAGTIDLLVLRRDTINDPISKKRVTLVDWKTNKEIKFENKYHKTKNAATSNIIDCNFNKYQLQLSVYAYILETYYDMIIDGLKLVHLKEDAYVVHNCDYLKQTVKRMIDSRKV